MDYNVGVINISPFSDWQQYQDVPTSVLGTDSPGASKEWEQSNALNCEGMGAEEQVIKEQSRGITFSEV